MFKNRAEYMQIVSGVAQTLATGFAPVLGIHPWFIIKIQLSYQLHLTYATGKWPNLSTAKTPYTGHITNVKAALKVCKQLLKTLLRLYKTYRSTTCDNVDVVAVANTNQNDTKNNSVYNKFLHPYLNEFAYQKVLVHTYNDVNNNTFEQRLLQELIACYVQYYKLYLYINSKAVKQLRRYTTQINTQLQAQQFESVVGLEDFIVTQVIDYKVHYKAYRLWLKLLKPHTVIGYCYYNSITNAVFGAANSLGVNTIECQHSAISHQHFAYAKWECVDKIIQHLPKQFYVWTPEDARVITTNFTSQLYQPEVVIKGIKHLQVQNVNTSQAKSNTVLICLQGIWMPDWLETFIRQDEHYQWYIRLHPRYPNDKEQLNSIANLKKSNIHIKAANTQSIEQVLQQSATLITCFSGTALEAHALGLQVLIYGDEGKETYQNYITNGQFSYIEDEISLETCLL